MKSENKHKKVENKLILLEEEKRDKMPSSILRFWQDLQRDLRLQSLVLIDFQAKSPTQNFWRWHLSYPTALIANENLKKAFQSKNKVPANWAKVLEKSIARKGFFIPQNDIVKLGDVLLQNHLVFQQKLHADFQFEKYLAAVQHKKHQLANQNIPLPIIAIREHFRFYFLFLKEVFQTDFHAVKSIRKILNQSISVADFNEKLPSEQLASLFYHVVNQHFCDNFDEHFFQKLVNKSSVDIQSFWKKRSRYFFDFFENHFSTKPNKEAFDIFSSVEIEEDFFEICKTDFELIQFQEIMDNASENDIINFFPEIIKDKYGKNRKLSLTQKMKKAIGDASILERIQLLSDQNEPDPKPNFSPSSESWIDETEYYWYELEEEETVEFRNAINDYLDPVKLERLKMVAQNRWDLHLENICNAAASTLAPFILWKRNKENWIPTFNIMPEASSRRLEYQFEKRIENELTELDLLKEMLKDLYTNQSLVDIRNFTNSSHKFKIKFIEKKWNDSLSAHILNVKNRENYRLRRMFEFGIVEGDEVVNRRKDIWLDEMLKVEKEIQPYVLFVKNAFQGALPVRKTVEFDPFRHTFDGVEFDPETIQDQEKWLNGEVMKSLRIKVDKEPVEQINAFALDSSGSMKHEKMRNLFKLCYLLVLGLEDRKTYDAFHFFSTYFIETANFTHDYTNRNLLFKVLRNISKIKNGKVFYEGKGGTNISAGVVECHQRIQNFIREKNFDLSGKKYLTSIFVITDGEPSAGILDINLLREKIVEKRNEGNTAIKGIYIKPKGEESMFMEQIFGINEFVETEDFDNAIERFIQVMTATYKQQRRKLKQSKKKKHGKNS